MLPPEVKLVITECYKDISDVFSEIKPTGLALHCHYDCAIKLLLGTWSHVPPVPLQNIVPSTIPASAGFFFIEKKGGAYGYA